MSRGRTITSSVALVVLIGVSSACGSSKSYTAAQHERTQQERAAEAAQAKAAARRQAAALRKQAEARRKAAMAARLRENRRRALAASTSTTTTPAPTSSTTPAPPTTEVPTTSPTSPPVDPPAANPQDDLAAIQGALEDLNAAFRASVAAGITHSETVNYWVATGVYTGRQCAAFEAQQGGGVIRESLAVQAGSVKADPGWIDPVVGSKPGGRVYRLVATNTQTLVTTGEKRTVTVPLHVTVRPDGQVLLFLRCK